MGPLTVAPGRLQAFLGLDGFAAVVVIDCFAAAEIVLDCFAGFSWFAVNY